jgi:hypothetical protein
MKLGAFSISLTVKDLAKKLRFTAILGSRGSAEQMSTITQSHEKMATLWWPVSGMFERNMLTFNLVGTSPHKR